MKVLTKRPYVVAAFQFHYAKYYAELMNRLRSHRSTSNHVLAHTM
jgi:hypothetical protein